MSDPAVTAALTGRLAVLSAVSFGGIPAILPDLHDFLVTTNGWISDRDFANCFAAIQTVPGPSMILMMSFIGWKIGGLTGAIACALAIFGPSCSIVYVVHSLWERFRDHQWQQAVRRGLAPVTIGLVIAGGTVMARAADTGWPSVAVTIAAAALMLGTKWSPIWTLAAAGVLGGLGLL
jgi:chromate transporter